jgi:hypothetical protein
MLGLFSQPATLPRCMRKFRGPQPWKVPLLMFIKDPARMYSFKVVQGLVETNTNCFHVPRPFLALSFFLLCPHLQVRLIQNISLM